VFGLKRGPPVAHVLVTPRVRCGVASNTHANLRFRTDARVLICIHVQPVPRLPAKNSCWRRTA